MNVLRTPLALGKLTGLAAGLIAFFSIPAIWPDAPSRIQWGFLLWYTTFGAVVGVFGTDPQPSAIVVRVPWWLRAAGVGAWMNLVLTFFAYDTFRSFLLSFFGSDLPFTSPWWFAMEGAIVGLLVGFVATRFSRTAPGGTE